MYGLGVFGLTVVSQVKTTSSAVIGLPSCQRTVGFSWKSSVRQSLASFHDFASSPTTLRSRSSVTRPLYIRSPTSWDAESLVMFGIRLETLPIEASMRLSP